MAAPSNSIDVLDHGFVRLDAGDGRRPVGGQRRAGLVRRAGRHDGRPQRGPRAVPHARAPRHAVRAQLLPLPHQGAAVRDARVAAPPRRLVQRALGPLLGAARRVLRARPPATCARRSASRAHTRSSRSPTTPPRACARASQASYAESYRRYQELLAAGVAKEVARSVLPVGLYTEFYWSVNARSMMNFLSLRNARDGPARDPRLRRGGRAALRARRCPSRTPRSSRRDGRRPERPPAARARGAGPRRRRAPRHAAAAVGARPRPLLRGRRRRGLDADRLRPRHAGHRPALGGGARAARAPARAPHRDHALPPRPHRGEHRGWRS